MLEEWHEVYLLLGTAAATIVALLFVALSLRLNIFRDARLADVRDFAAGIFGSFFGLLLVSLLALAPLGRMAAGLPIAVLGLLRALWLVWVSRESVRLGPDPQPVRWRWPFIGLSFVSDLALAVAGLTLAAGWEGAPALLFVAALAVLTFSVAGVWVLFVRAGTEP
jgi:hypothetical protein